MKSFFISALAACMSPKPIFLDGDNWDLTYEWSCEEMEVENKAMQINAFAEYPITSTTTRDLFNRFPESRIVEIESE